MSETMELEEQAPTRDLAEYLEIPLRYPYHAVLPFLGVMLIVTALLAVLPKKYRSSTLIMVESERASAAMNTDRLYERLGTIKQEIQSRTQLEKVINEMEPYSRYGEFPMYRQVEAMRRATHIRVQGNDAFVIEYVHYDPEVARDVTNRLATLFIENTGKLREAAVQEARGFTQTSLEESKKMLQEAEQAVWKFKERYMGALPEQLDSNLAALTRLQMEKQTVEASIQSSEQRRDFLLSTVANRDTTSSPGSADLKELQTLKENLEKLRLRYTDRHPDVIALRTRIEVLENEVVEVGRAKRSRAADVRASASSPEGDTAAPLTGDGSVIIGETELDLTDPNTYAIYANLQKTDQELAALRRNRDELEKRIAEFQARVELTPRIEGQLYTLERDYNLRRENYDFMLRKNMEAELAERLEHHWQGDLFRVLDPAHVPERPVSPNVALFIMGGLFFGALSGLILAALADYMDHSVKNVRQLEGLMPFPVLATLPHIGKIKKSSKIYA
jgi:polysaccharide chain length determinant protein (PEP-CTERM system associated)